MSQALALVRRTPVDAIEALLFAIVASCGCALLAAGQALPF